MEREDAREVLSKKLIPTREIISPDKPVPKISITLPLFPLSFYDLVTQKLNTMSKNFPLTISCTELKLYDIKKNPEEFLESLI